MIDLKILYLGILWQWLLQQPPHRGNVPLPAPYLVNAQALSFFRRKLELLIEKRSRLLDLELAIEQKNRITHSLSVISSSLVD